MTSKQAVLIALLLGVAGCSGDGAGCICEAPDVSATVAWGGSEITLTSAGFVGRDTLPVVLADAETLAVRSSGAGAAVVTLPGRDRIGPLKVVLSSGEQLETPSVRTYGYVEELPIAHLEGDPQDYPAAGNPVVLVYRNGRPVGVNLRTGVETPFSAPNDTGYANCNSGPAVGWDPGVITTGRANRFVAVASQSPHTIVDSTSLICSGTYPAVNLGPGRWLVNQKQWLQIVKGGTTTAYHLLCEGYSFRFGPPQRKLVIPIRCNDQGVVPVFDGVTLDTVYQLHNYQLHSAAFTDDGDTAYAVANSPGPSGGNWLKRFDPATGATSDSVRLSVDVSANDVAIDPIGPWLYLSSGGQGGRFPTITIYRRATLERVAVMSAPVDEDQSYLFYHHLVVAPGRELYLLLSTNRSYAQARLHRWSLMP